MGLSYLSFDSYFFLRCTGTGDNLSVGKEAKFGKAVVRCNPYHGGVFHINY